MERYNRLSQIILLLLLSSAVVPVMAAQSGQEYFEPGIALPDAEGRELILSACTKCHTLEGVPAYQKYWGYERWLPMVENMIKHGATLNDAEKVIVTRYLAKYFGTDK